VTAARWFPPVLAAPLLAGCVTIQSQQDAARALFEVPAHAVQDRVRQTRRFETRDEASLLMTCSALLMDLGFTVDSMEDSLGVMVSSKDRGAVQTGAVIASMVMAALTGADVPYECRQRLRASVVVHPVGTRSTAVRVTFQRIVWDTRGTVTRRQQLDDAAYYEEFFAKLSGALFLEAHEP